MGGRGRVANSAKLLNLAKYTTISNNLSLPRTTVDDSVYGHCAFIIISGGIPFRDIKEALMVVCSTFNWAKWIAMFPESQ